jgi:hypothetical protein
MSGTEKMGIGDSVVAALGKLTGKLTTRSYKEKMGARANVHVVHKRGDLVLADYWGENLVTDVGDHFLAARAWDDTYDIISGMKLGNDGATPEAKNGAGAAMVAYIGASEEALDATASDATKGAGAGWRITYVCTWIAGDVTDADIEEVCLTNQTALTDSTSAEADTIARYQFAAPIDKQAGDSLEVTWQIDIQGS